MKNKNQSLENYVSNSLKSLLGDQLGTEVFDANFNHKKLKGYVKGEIMTLKELKALPNRSVIHLKYTDEDGGLRENGFQILEKDDSEDWTTEEGYSIPLNNIKNQSVKIQDIDNSGWTFTIRHAIKK